MKLKDANRIVDAQLAHVIEMSISTVHDVPGSPFHGPTISSVIQPP